MTNEYVCLFYVATVAAEAVRPDLRFMGTLLCSGKQILSHLSVRKQSRSQLSNQIIWSNELNS